MICFVSILLILTKRLKCLLSEVTTRSGLMKYFLVKDVVEFLMIRTYHFTQLGIYEVLDEEIIWIYGFSKSIEENFDLLIGSHE